MMQDVRGFRVEYATEIAAPREAVFDAMTRDLAEWFPHRFQADAGIVQEYGLLAREFEDWGNGDGALFSVTTAIKRPSMWTTVTMPGAFGPYMSVSRMTFDEVPGGMRLGVSMFALGDVSEEDEQMFANGYPPIFERLRQYVESR